jgi:hypothetical protein
LQIYQENGQFENFRGEFITLNAREDKKELLLELFLMSFNKAFEYYLSSRQFIKDYTSIREKEGDKIAVLFNYVSKIYVEYYTLSKGNSKKSE